MIGGYQIIDIGKAFGKIELTSVGTVVSALVQNNDAALYDIISKNDKPLLLTNINAVVKIAFVDAIIVDIDNVFMMRLITVDNVNDPPADNLMSNAYFANINPTKDSQIIIALNVDNEHKRISLYMEAEF